MWNVFFISEKVTSLKEESNPLGLIMEMRTKRCILRNNGHQACVLSLFSRV